MNAGRRGQKTVGIWSGGWFIGVEPDSAAVALGVSRTQLQASARAHDSLVLLARIPHPVLMLDGKLLLAIVACKEGLRSLVLQQ